MDTLLEKAFQRAEHPFRSRVRWAIELDVCRQEGTRPGLSQTVEHLPLEILVAERGGAVVLAYSQPVVAERHGNMERHAQRLRMMATALDALSAAASGARVRWAETESTSPWLAPARAGVHVYAHAPQEVRHGAG